MNDFPIFADALAQVVQKARAKLPESLHARLDKAVGLVEANAVEFAAVGSGHALVRSASRPDVVHTVNGTCDCEDAHFQAPDGLCAHRLAVGLTRKAAEVLHTPTAAPEEVFHLDLDGYVLAPAPVDAAPVVEVPAIFSTVLIIDGRSVEIKLCDTDDARLLARLRGLLQQFPVPEAPAPPAPGEGWCGEHGCQMKLNHGKDGSTWYSHKLPGGGWCKGTKGGTHG